MGQVDSLTGLHNYRWLEKMLPRYINRFTQDETTLTLIMSEIDSLELIRDKGGEHSSDQVISSLSEIMLSSTRPTDMMVRDDNDVFIMVLPECDSSSGRKIIDRIRGLFNVIKMKIPSGTVFTGFTLSVGITKLEKEDTYLTLTDRLNDLLSTAKEKGRNWVAE